MWDWVKVNIDQVNGQRVTGPDMGLTGRSWAGPGPPRIGTRWCHVVSLGSLLGSVDGALVHGGPSVGVP